MLSFRQFLFERIRSPEEATKLGEYLVKRFKRSRHYMISNDYIDLTRKDYEPNEDNDEAFSRAWTYADNIFRKRKKNIVEIPIDVLTKNNRQLTNFNRNYFLKHKLDDDRPINVVQHRGTKEFNVIDGFHRIDRNRLLGKKTIKANLQFVGRNKRRIDENYEEGETGNLYGSLYHSFKVHNQKIDLLFIPLNSQPGHYEVIYGVNSQIMKDRPLPRAQGLDILKHVRNNIDNFVQREKPKGLRFSSSDPAKIALYDHYSSYLKQKYGGRITKEPLAGSTLHTIKFNHENNQND